MSDEATKPKRKRWRWIIAGVLLFVVAVAGWWHWPRGDRRLVGTWQQSISDGRTAVPLWKVTYFRNGTMAFDDKEQQRGWPFRTWRIEGTRLIWGWRLPLPDSAITKWLTKKVRTLPGMANWGLEWAADIIKMTDQEVRFVIPKEHGTHIGGIPDGLISGLLVNAAKQFSSKATRFRFGTESIYEIGDVSTNCVVSTDCIVPSRGAMKRLEMRTIFTRIPE